MEKNNLDYVKRFIDFQLSMNRYGSANITDVSSILRPRCRNNNILDILSYEDRIEIAKFYLEKVIDEKFSHGFNYFKNDYNSYAYSSSYYGGNTFKEILAYNGYECYKSVLEKDLDGTPTVYDYQKENFYQLFLDKLYEYWDKQLELYGQEDKQCVFDTLFMSQLSGQWFYYNGFKQNFLKVYLKYVKSKGYKVNIFKLYKNKMEKITKNMKQGITHYTKCLLFECLITTFDFYMAVLDLYGEDNEKAITKLQDNLNYIFKDCLNVEKLGFMNTFLYTNYHNSKLRYQESYNDVGFFWKDIYTKDLNPTLKSIFLNALVYTWNKSPIPKVRNSLQLIATLSMHNYNIDGNYNLTFPYTNEKIFYNDLLMNANKLKKSVKAILFTKAIAEEGGLFLGG